MNKKNILLFLILSFINISLSPILKIKTAAKVFASFSFLYGVGNLLAIKKPGKHILKH